MDENPYESPRAEQEPKPQPQRIVITPFQLSILLIVLLAISGLLSWLLLPIIQTR